MTILDACPRESRSASYTHTVYDSIDEVDVQEWDFLRQGDGDVFLDPRYIRVQERSLSDSNRFWHVVVRDADGAPIAIACLFLCTFDLSTLVFGRWKKVVGMMKRVIPRLKRFKLLICGLPVTCGGSALRFAPGADTARILRTLDEVMAQIARREGARCRIVSQFSPEECARMQSLASLGYERLEDAPMNIARPGFRDFADYFASLKSRKRHPIDHSWKKFAASGLSVVHLRGCEGAGRVYTDEVHHLYQEVLQGKRSCHKVNPCFFRELARHMPEESVFTFIYEGQRVAAFAASLCTQSTFYQLFVGFDHKLAPACDLYFNLVFNVLDLAYRRDVPRILLGSTSDALKVRKLGASQEPRYSYMRWHRPLVSRVAAYLVQRPSARSRATETAATAGAP